MNEAKHLIAPHWGAIFDWDGVIIDSSRAHELSWDRLASEAGLSLPEGHFVKGFGRKNDFIIPEILGWRTDPAEIVRLSLRKEELYRIIVQESGQTPLPGVRSWLKSLKAAGIPCAIASSTHRANIDLILGLTGLSEFFQSILTAEDVKLGKPHPEVFLKAASSIHRAPGECVVFEDAHPGIAAARSGGMRVVGVATTHPAEALTEADLAVKRLDELTVKQLSEWFHP